MVWWVLLGRAVTVTVQPEIAHQTVNGWSAAVDIQLPPYFADSGEEMFRRAVEEVGISRLRVGIFAGSTENTDRSFQRWQSGEIDYDELRLLRYSTLNDNDDPFEIDPDGFDFALLDWRIENYALPLKRILEERGEPFWFYVSYVAFTNQWREAGYDGQYVHDDPEEYAELVLATYLHMQDRWGFVPDGWEVILEPDLVPEWRRDPTLIGEVMLAAGRRLQQHGFSPYFIAPSVTNMNNAVPFVSAALSVPGAEDYLGTLSYHRYAGRTEENLQAIAAAAAAVDVPPAMLEFWFGRGDQHVLYEDLTTGNNGFWESRALIDNFDHGPGGFVMKPDVRHTSLYMAFARPGATRIEATTNAFGTKALAFVNPDGSQTVVTEISSPRTVRIRGLDRQDYRIFYATETGCGTAIPAEVDADGSMEFRMPGSGTLAVTSFAKPGSRFLTDAQSSRCRPG